MLLRAAEAARRLADKLNADESVPRDTSNLGDRILLPANFSGMSLSGIRAQFGPRFAEMVWDQELGVWSGPVPSGYGVHAVFIHERSDAELPDFGQVKEQLTADWLAARQRELTGGAYGQLRKRYRVLVEGMPYDIDEGG